MQDDPEQSPKATRLVESLTGEQPGFVPLVAVAELVGVLSSGYGLNKDQLSLVLQAQRRFAKGGADVADCPLERIAPAHGCRATMTIDTRAAKAAGMTLVA